MFKKQTKKEGKKENKIIKWNNVSIKEYEERLSRGEDIPPRHSPYRTEQYGIRKEGMIYEFEEWELEEWGKCACDIYYFIDNYIYVKNENGIREKIILREYQKEIIDMFDTKSRCLLMASRQTGKCVSPFTLVEWKFKNKVYESTIGFLYYKIKIKNSILDWIYWSLFSLHYWL